MNRRTLVALTASLAVHVAAGLALRHQTSRERAWPTAPGRLVVDLSPSVPEPPGSEAPAPEPPAPETAPVAARQAPVAGPALPPSTAPPAWEPRPYPRPLAEDDEAALFRSPRRHAGVTAGWWSRRSAVAMVETWREGGTPQDSTLDRRVSPAERILASTNRGLNENFLRLRESWALERWREAQAENFPPMGQLPADFTP